MQNNETYKFLSNDAEFIQHELTSIGDMQLGSEGIKNSNAIIEEYEFFYICLDQNSGDVVLARELAQTKNEITADATAGDFKKLFSLTIHDAIQKGIVSDLKEDGMVYNAKEIPNILKEYKL